MENLARYIIRASFSQERMTYLREVEQVEYRSKDGKETKVFDALEWIAAMCSHVPSKGEQMVRYYGHYSNVSRGRRKKADEDDRIPSILEPELTDKAFRKNWARMIQKIYEVNPLLCDKCGGPMHVIAFIEDSQIIKKILKHLDLWDVKRKPSPCAHSPPMDVFPAYDKQPGPSADDYIIDPDYPVEVYF
jgi:hypothetical protein